MKKLFIYLVLAAGVFFLSNCQSSKSLLQKGEYGEAVKKSVRKLQKDPADVKEIAVLAEAFPRAQQYDLDQILFLKKEGRPDRWETITRFYYEIKERQDLVKTLPRITDPASGQALGLSFIECDNDLIESKKHAGEYLYAHGTELLSHGSREDARIAYGELSRIRDFYPGYRDSEAQAAKAREAGITNVLYRVEDQSEWRLPPQLAEELGRIQVQDLNKTWVRYSASYDENIHYDYMIRVAIHSVSVSPESVNKNRYVDFRKVEDGYTYTLDAKGNVMKDSKGNDIKEPKFREIQCTVIESFQTKSALISASVDFITVSDNQVFHSEPAAGEAFFRSESAIAFGDFDALSEDSRVKISRSPLPFPGNTDMVFRAGTVLKEVLRNQIWEESAMFK